MLFLSHSLLRLISFAFVDATLVSARHPYARQDVPPANSTINATATTGDSTVTPAPCCWILGAPSAVQVNTWYTNTAVETVATVVTTYIQYQDTIIAANSSTKHLPKNESFDGYGSWGPAAGYIGTPTIPGNVPTTLIPDGLYVDGEYAETTVGHATDTAISFDFTDLVVSSPTPFLYWYDIQILATQPDARATMTSIPSSLCGTMSSFYQVVYTNDEWVETTTNLVQPTDAPGLFLGPIAFGNWYSYDLGPYVEPIPTPPPNDKIWIPIPSAAYTSILNNATIQSLYPWISNCQVWAGQGEPTVHVPVNQLTTTSSSTLTLNVPLNPKATPTSVPAAVSPAPTTPKATVAPTLDPPTASASPVQPSDEPRPQSSAQPDTLPSSAAGSPDTPQSSTQSPGTPVENSNTPTVIVTVGSSTITASENQPVVIGSDTLTAGGSAATIGGQVVSVGSSAIVVGGSTAVFSQASVSPATVITVGSIEHQVSSAGSDIIIDGSVTVQQGSVASINGGSVSLVGDSIVIGSGSVQQTVAIPAATQAPSPALVTFGNEVYTAAAAGSDIVVDGVTVASGSPAIVDGVTASLVGGSLVLASGSAVETIAVPAAITAAPGSSEIMPNLNGYTIIPAGSNYVIDGSITVQPGAETVVDGETYSISGSSLAIADGSSTEVLALPTSGTNYDLVTYGNDVFTASSLSDGDIVVDGSVTIASGTAVVVNGVTMSLAGESLVLASGTASAMTEGVGGAILSGLDSTSSGVATPTSAAPGAAQTTTSGGEKRAPTLISTVLALIALAVSYAR